MNEKPLIRLREVYDKLRLEYNRCDDDSWMKDINNWFGIDETERNIPDYYFILNLCYGPWREKRQKEVWQTVHKRFKEHFKGDLRQIDDVLGFPLAWQEKRARRLRNYLKKKGVSFAKLLQLIKSKNGLVIRNGFRKVIGASSDATKTISTFIRDYLRKDVFPIDSRIEKMLSYLGLPRDEDMMVVLCKKVGVNPRILNRMLYKHYGEKCEGDMHASCPFEGQCYQHSYIQAMFEVKSDPESEGEI